MKIKIIRIYSDFVTCELEDGGLIDIGKQWILPNIKVGDEIEFEYDKDKKTI